MERRSNERRITPRQPTSMQAIIDRIAREEGVSPSQFYAVAAAFLAGYEMRRRDDAIELERLSEVADDTQRRVAVIEGRLGIRQRPRRGEAP